MANTDQETSDMGNSPLTPNYIVKYLLPIILVCIGGATWGARLEYRIDSQERELLENKEVVRELISVSGLLKVEQTKLTGQVETLRVMLSSVSDTAKRIEDKLDRVK
jgi:hypothetical protein